MKTLTFFILLLFKSVFVFSQVSGEKDSASLEIFLIRHAPVDLKKPILCSSSKAAKLQKQYNELPIKKFDPEPVRKLLGNGKFALYTSTLPRTIETAEILFPDVDTIRASSLFNEYDLTMVAVPILPLPYGVWTALSRILWLTSINNKGENRLKSYLRMKKATDELVHLATVNKRVILVSHGYLISEIRKELKRRGWDLQLSQGNKNLAVSKLSFSGTQNNQSSLIRE